MPPFYPIRLRSRRRSSSWSVDHRHKAPLRLRRAHARDAFLRCYSENAQIESGDGAVLAAGREEIRGRYDAMFARFPGISVRKIRSFSVGSYVVQDEEVQGREPEPERHVAIYRVEAGLIVHERLLR